MVKYISCSGHYGDAITLKWLKDFHRRRVQILAESGADLLAFETIPNKLECQVCDSDNFTLPDIRKLDYFKTTHGEWPYGVLIGEARCITYE